MSYRSQDKIYVVFFTIVVAIAIFVGFVFYLAMIDRNLPKLQSSDFDSALRGLIITQDGFNIANSQKLYKAMVNTKNIDPNKKELFIKLYTLYSGDDPKKTRKILQKNGLVTLSYGIHAKDAAYLKELARKLYLMKVFIPYQDPKTGSISTQGLSILESGEQRLYMAKDTLTPAIGYIKKIEEDGITKVTGVKGIEKIYDKFLSLYQNGVILGSRDLSNNIILSGNTQISKRFDGYNVVLNIPLKLQKIMEKMADQSVKEFNAKEIVIAIMEAKTGNIINLTSTMRYDPNNINKKDYEALNSTISEYAYEMGSVIKPIIFSLLLRENRVNPLEIVRTYGGKYKLANRIIRDTHETEYLSAENVIVQSSNIGMIQLIQRMNEIDLYNGLFDFGFSKKTGIDLSYEQTGALPTISEIQNPTYKAAVSYGYGIQATFIQLLSAYNAINNDGLMVTPRIINNLQRDGKSYIIKQKEPKRVLAIDTARTMKRILKKVVESPNGTAQKAKIQGLNISGKTGTAHIATGGGYSNTRYNASFFGFASDSFGNNYTIGVLVREPMRPYPYYFASWSALPVFKNTVEILIENKYLFPNQERTTNSSNFKGREILD